MRSFKARRLILFDFIYFLWGFCLVVCRGDFPEDTHEPWLRNIGIEFISSLTPQQGFDLQTSHLTYFPVSACIKKKYPHHPAISSAYTGAHISLSSSKWSIHSVCRKKYVRGFELENHGFAYQIHSWPCTTNLSRLRGVNQARIEYWLRANILYLIIFLLLPSLSPPNLPAVFFNLNLHLLFLCKSLSCGAGVWKKLGYDLLLVPSDSKHHQHDCRERRPQRQNDLVSVGGLGHRLSGGH